MQHEPNRDRAFCRFPVCDGFGYSGIGRVHRLNKRHATRVGALDLKRVTGVVAVDAERRDKNGPVDSGHVHGGYQLVAGHMGRPVSGSLDPRPAGVIVLVGVNLGVDDQQGFPPGMTCK